MEKLIQFLKEIGLNPTTDHTEAQSECHPCRHTEGLPTNNRVFIKPAGGVSGKSFTIAVTPTHIIKYSITQPYLSALATWYPTVKIPYSSKEELKKFLNVHTSHDLGCWK